MPVQTPLGIGEIVERSSVRGRSQVKVAGRGFSAWYDEAIVRPVGHLAAWENEDATENVDEDNSTTLPWNPDPQVENILSTQSTILPGEYGIDADERLHPADSLTFADRAEPRGPQPSPDLFAKGAARHPGHPDSWPFKPNAADYDEWDRREESHGRSTDSPTHPDRHAARYANPDLFAKGAALRDTLGPKYATWLLDAHVDHYNDPIQRFRDDPDREIGRLGHLLSDTLDEDTRHYGMLIEADREMRLAAWADVRNKASHLRSEGRVHVLDYAPDRIYASVDGDHGTYDVMVKRGNEYTGGQAVSNWHCSCKWGSWAFQRQYKHVGRLCSHALASLDEMQSRYLKDNPGHFERRRVATVTSEFTDWADDNGVPADLDGVSDFVMTHPDLSDDDIADLYAYAEDHQVRREVRDYEDPLSQNWPDVLTTQRGRLSPELVFPAEDDFGHRHEMVDVQADDRETTGPGQIQHFSARTAAGGGVDDLYGVMGLDAPASKPLPSNPFAGGGWDPTQLPGVSGPTNSTPTDPTGGMLPLGGGGTPSPAPQGTPGNDNSWWGGNTAPGNDNSWWGGNTAPGNDNSWWGGNTAPSPAANAGVGGGSAAGAGTSAPSPAANAGVGGGSAAGAGTSGGGGGWSANGNTDPIGTGDYTIQSGDTLSDIAQRAGYGDNYQALADANHISDPDMIYAGDTLKIPGLDTAGSDTTEHMPAGTTPQSDVATPDISTGQGTGPAPGPTDTTPSVTPPSIGDTTSGLPPMGTPDTSLTGVNDSGSMTDPGLTPDPRKTSRYLTDADFEDGRYARVRTADLLEKLRELSDEPIPHGSAAAHNDEVREVVEELRDRGMDASQMVAALEATDPHQGFSGSGFDPKHTWGTSQSYVEKHERPHQVDVTNLDDSDEMIRYTEKESALDTTDVVRRFHADLQREGGASYLDGGAGGDFSDDAIAARADAMVRTAGRKFTLAEQRELEDESHPLGARNKPSYADLAGTHYVD